MGLEALPPIDGLGTGVQAPRAARPSCRQPGARRGGFIDSTPLGLASGLTTEYAPSAPRLLRFLGPWHRRYGEWVMRETAADIEFLQRLMDETLADITPHMASIVSPDKRLRASQVVRYLDGIKYVAFGSVTPANEPRVSPLDSVFVRGRFTLSTDSSAVRVANLRHNPACSLVHMVGDTVAIVVHGRVEWITRDHADHDEIHSIWTSAYESDPYAWGNDIVLFRAEPAAIWAYAQRPNDFPE